MPDGADMRILISGGTGFIGHALSEALSLNHDVTIICRTNQTDETPRSLDRVEWLTDIDVLSIKNLQFDVFIHCAWSGSTGQARTDLALQAQNIEMSVQYYQVAAAFGCKKFIVLGTISELLALSEKNQASHHPNVIYGSFKALCHRYLKNAEREYGLDVIWLRLTNVFSANASQANLLGVIFDNIKHGIITEVSSCDHPYDFLFIDDAVQKIRFFTEQDVRPGAYNVASGKPRKLRLYLEEINELLGAVAVSFNSEKNDGLHWSESWFDAAELDVGLETVEFKAAVSAILGSV